ncbi:exodeoxyribonuclease VII large subunit, partial [Lysobacter sp. 2RAB21]
PLAQAEVLPVPVQGDGAAERITAMLMRAQAAQRYDVIVLARGGGSLEDLWAFNDERLARAIAASAVPVVSAIGHETDFT